MKNENGFSLLEVCMALVIIGTLFIGMSAGLTHLQAANKHEQTKLYASRIVVSLTHLVSLKSTIRASTLSELPANQLFADQLYREESALHLNGDGSFTGVALFLPLVAIQGGVFVSGGQITGPPESPVRYNLNGDSCNTALEICEALQWPIEAITEYNFACPSLFHPSYDGSQRGGQPYYGPIYPDGYRPHTECEFKAQLNVRLTIRESRDSATAAFHGFFKEFSQVIQISTMEWPRAHNP